MDFAAGVKALRRANVANDIAIALRTGDRRLIGIWGYALDVPGIEMIGGEGPQGFSVVPIAGTSDSMEGLMQGEFQRLLYQYAEKYNRSVVGLSGRTRRFSGRFASRPAAECGRWGQQE